MIQTNQRQKQLREQSWCDWYVSPVMRIKRGGYLIYQICKTPSINLSKKHKPFNFKQIVCSFADSINIVMTHTSKTDRRIRVHWDLPQDKKDVVVGRYFTAKKRIKFHELSEDVACCRGNVNRTLLRITEW